MNKDLTITELCLVDPSRLTTLTKWALGLQHEDWPQQEKLRPSFHLPAVVSDLNWHNFGFMVAGIVTEIMEGFEGYVACEYHLANLVAGQTMVTHTDQQTDEWIARVHVPILSNPECWMSYGDSKQHLKPGFAYLVNANVPHGGANLGVTDRIHFFFDVRTAYVNA